MNAASDPGRPEELALPTPQFRRFVAVFHFVFMFGLVFTLLLRWRRPELRWSETDTALAALAVLQVGLYALFMIFQWKPESARGWWIAYFLVSFAIWYTEWRLEPMLAWAAWAYLGQMFGVLPPRLALPASVVVFAGFFGTKFGWSGLSHMGAWEWIGGFCLVLCTVTLGMFLHGLTQTSSERATLIRELQEAKKQLEASQAREVELAALKEREHLARDLHDSLGHGLVTLTVQLEAAQRLYTVDPVRASALMEEMKQLTRTSMEQLRRALAGLRTPALGERELGQAIREHCGQVAQRGELQVHCDLPEGRLDTLKPAVSEVLWRVTQEGLTNVLRHAKAKEARISLRVDDSTVCLKVADNGIGLPPNAETKPGHFGLRGLRERVEGLGGSLKTESAPPGGTVIEARLPLFA